MRRLAIGAVLLAFILPSRTWAACCIEGCGTTTPSWTSCTASTTCTGGFCPGIGAATQSDASATCGVGSPWSSCPATEAGHCSDGVNNDAWTGDTLTDCADPDCFGDPACVQKVPALSASRIATLVLLLGIAGVAGLQRRYRRS